MFTGFAVAACLAGVVVYFIVKVPQNGINFPESPAPLGIYRSAAVAADAGRCSKIGADILRNGGSAVDGAIAAAICDGVIKMHNSGIGGGFFMTIWDQTEQVAYVLDARESAPHYATEEMYEMSNISSTLGPFAIAIPGEIAGYWEAHQRFGKVPWKTLFEPTIKLCREGFSVPSILAEALKAKLSEISLQTDQKAFEGIIQFLTNPETQKPYKTDEIFHCNKLADTLSKIVDLGAAGFYNGSLAADILADLQEVGSAINQADLSSYRIVWRKPIETVLQNRYRLISTPPPGSGAILSFILNILSGYNFNESSSQDTVTYHRIIEAFKFGYAKRAHLGDESFVPGLDDHLANLTSPSYGDYVRSLINDTMTQPTSYYDENVASGPRDHGTAHISVLDQFGNAASITSTINTHFGSGVVGRRTGIIFNNEMDDFSSPNQANFFGIPPSPNNFIRPGKRPQSSTCPAVVLDLDPSDRSGKTRNVHLVVGASGGSAITSAVAYITARMLWFQENAKQAIDALRFHHQLIPETLVHEDGMPTFLLEALKAKGHVNQTLKTAAYSDAQAIIRFKDGIIQAHSDFRKVIGYSDGF